MASLTIGEVSRLSGVRPSALRYHESVGVLPAAGRQRGQRRYGDAILARLAVVRLAQAVGFTVAKMRALVAGCDQSGVDAERWRELAGNKLHEIDGLIARAEQMKSVLEASLDCDCMTLDGCALVLARQEPGDDTGVRR